MILLLSATDLNEGEHRQTLGEEDLRALVDTTHISECARVLDVQTTEKFLKRTKAGGQVVLVSVTA
jgi:hypothetical protein